MIEVWVKGYASTLSNVKLASLLGVKKVINDKDYTSHSYKTELPKTWIVGNTHSITESDISTHLLNFESDKTE